MATIVSWPLEETIISLFISRTPFAPGVGLRDSGFESRITIPESRHTSVRESAHSYVQHQPEAREGRDHRRPAVAHERESESFDGRQPCRHGDVVDHLERKAGEN